MSDNNPLGDQWRAAQRQFVDAWSQMAGAGPAKSSADQANLWAEGFDRWRKAAGGEAQPEIRGVIDKCLSMGKGYFALAEQLGVKLDGEADPAACIDQWFDQLGRSLRQLSTTPDFDPSAAGEFLAPWFNPGNSWQQFANTATLGNPSVRNLLGLQGGAFDADESIAALGAMPDSPGVGPMRESQEKRQQAIRLALEYQQASQRFNQAVLQVAIESIEVFRERLGATPANQQPESLRAIYDLWVEVSEQRYGEFAIGMEYPRLYGDMVNRLMLLRIHLNRMTDELMGAMNLPGSREIDTMQQRLQQLRRDNLEMKQAVGEIRAALATPAATGGAAKPARKQAAPKKAASTTRRKTGNGQT